MYNHGIKHDMLNKHFSHSNIKKVNDMNVDKIPDELLELKKQLIFQANNRLDAFEKETLKMKKYKILNNVEGELFVNCKYCNNKNINLNNTRPHSKTKTHCINKTKYYNAKLDITKVDQENVLVIEA
jgi:hypothetical protein